jgi:hypothetical protein
MQYSIPIKWCDVTRTLSGNVAIESLISSIELPPGFFWLVMVKGGKAEFRWNRKARIRRSGKGQITLEGRTGFPCELVTARTSKGDEVELLVVRGSTITRDPKADVILDLPLPIRWETLEQDLIPYRMMRIPPSMAGWVKYLGWGETIQSARQSGAYEAAMTLRSLVATKRESERLRLFNELKGMGVMMDVDTFE